MTPQKLLFSGLWWLGSVGCAVEPAPGDARTVDPSADRSGGNVGASGSFREPTAFEKAPLVVVLEGPDRVRPSEAFELTLRITRAPWARTPLDLTVAVPPGVTVLRGQTRERIATPGALVVRTLRLRADVIPEQDLVVEVDARARGFGAHSVQRFGFGRAPTAQPELPRTAPAAVNGRELGAAIPLRASP